MSTAENTIFLPPADELRDFLQSEGLTDTVDDADRVSLGVWLDRRLFVLAQIASEVERNNEVAARRIAMIRNHTDEQNAVLQRRAAYLEGLLQQMAAAYPYPKGAKTLKLPFGSIGVRHTKAKLVVVDADAVIAHFDAKQLPEMIRVKREVEKKAVNEYWESTGEEIPGTQVEPASERPFVRVAEGV